MGFSILHKDYTTINLSSFLKLRYLNTLEDPDLDMYQLPEAGSNLESLQKRSYPWLIEMIDDAYELIKLKGVH